MGYEPQARPAALPSPSAESSDDTNPDAYYHFDFYSASGDNYEGYIYDDADRYSQGQMVNSPLGANYGYYVIDYKQDYGYDLSSRYGGGTTYYNEGVVYVAEYHDYTGTNSTYNPPPATGPYTPSASTSPSPATGPFTDYTPYNYQHNWYSTTYGLGYEYDWVQKANAYDDYGYGGYYLIA